MGVFREALQVLIPVVEKVHMPWRDPESYDDWDSICATLFASIVVGSIESATDGMDFFPLPPYDHRIGSYNNKSYLSIAAKEASLAFVCLQTTTTRMDSCLFSEIDSNGAVQGHRTMKFDDVDFVFVGRKASSSSILKQLEVVL